eukprot:jgi/Tetstr1/440257/TSEL_028608.t1
MEKYRLLGIIGQGQYGTAHKVESLRENKLYCMKRIPMSKKDDTDGAMREAHLLSTLNHPNVLGYHESFLHDGSLCIVTHFCEEGDLFTLIRNRAKKKQYFREEEVVDMFLQVAMGLHHIHTKRVLHRDLKTQNIFVAKGGILKLGDFGISKVLEKTDEFATTVTGTPYYMAPEICKNEPYSLKSDIWSLGCVLYELCTLKHAFAADSLLSLVYQIVKGNFPPIPQDQFSSDLSNLVQALLAKDSQRRPTLQEVMEMPYVEQHKQRFVRNQRRLNTTARAAAAKPSAWDNIASGLPADPGFEAVKDQHRALTPRERLRLKKQQQADQRAMELRVASINMNPHRESTQQQVQSRKSQMIRGSSHGAAPRPSSARHRTSNLAREAGYGDTNSTVLMGSVAGDAPDGAAFSNQWHQQLMESDYDQVNIGTANFAASGRAQSDVMHPTGASVLLGSVVEGGAGTPRASSGPANFQYGINMNAPSTPVHFPSPHDEQPAAASQQRTSHFGADLDSANQRPSSSASSAGPVEVGGFRFGVELVNSGASGNSTGQDSLRSDVSDPVPQARSTRRHMFSSDDDSDDIQEEDDDDSYSDDFEDYSDDFEEDDDTGSGLDTRAHRPTGTPQMRSDREAMMRNLRRMNSSQEDIPPGSALEETVSSKVRNTKLDQLRARCQAALGRDFTEVYQYLRHARESFGYGDDEKLKMKLIEMVGRRKLVACFECDQLIFQELLQE